MSLFGSDSACASRTWTVLRPVDPEVLQRLLLYEAKTAYYLLGYYGDEMRCRMLIFPKRHDQEQKLMVEEDARTYSPDEAEKRLRAIHQATEGGLQLLCEAFGVLGCFRFLEGYYLLLITKRKALGSLAGHAVYGVADTALIPLSGSHDSWAERRYRKMLLSGVDLTKDFFFSYTYHISYTVQHNHKHEASVDPFDCIFVWNEYLTRDLRTALQDNKWVLPLVHGSWQQRNLSIFGKNVQLTLISRRSRRFAGTRYLKRGINQYGWVANEVETEQIVSLQNLFRPGVPSLASVVQIRGSIPLFWGQATSALNPRPSIRLYNIDPLYDATRKHFDDLLDRYGGQVIVLNLVKGQERNPRETILRQELARAISFLNQRFFQDSIVHQPWDFKAHMHKAGKNFLKEAEPEMRSWVDRTGFFMINPALARSAKNAEPPLQHGVLRSNCIDCLDRTNISQYLYGLMALGYQLCSLGLLATNEIDPDCSLAYQLMQMYEIMGNDLALQYGGSEAHGTFFEKMRGHSEAATQSRELLRSIKRYYSNAVSDPEKQDAINLFLGHFVPKHDKADVWELDSDYWLHCGVDWEKQNARFDSKSSASLATRLSGHSVHENISLKPPQKTSSIELFPVPIISQAGDPEASVTAEIPNKKDTSHSGWNLQSWFRSSREPTEFRLPNARGPVLHSFEEMLSVNPVIEVRLHDGVKRRQRDGPRIAFQNSFARLQKQESMTEQGSGPLNTPDANLNSDSFTGMRSCASSKILKANSATQVANGNLSHFTTMSDRPACTKTKFATQEFSSLLNDSTFGMVEDCPRPNSDTEVTGLRRRSWFSGLTRRSVDTQRQAKSATVAHRTLSTPADVEKRGIHQLGQGDSKTGNPCRSDPVEEFWDEYWSITEQSLTTELTLAERISHASNKREAARMARASNAFNDTLNKRVERMTAANVFLDDLFDQCLEKPTTTIDKPKIQSERLTEAVIVKTRQSLPCAADGLKSEGDASGETALGVRSNINELLYCSASGPYDRILEKWFLADKQAEADYYRNLSWIVTPVDSLPIKAGGITA